tara:strand:+ start:2244 stop:2945 length:702 start_codon:yes stop_codon:yes gene_type:complete
MNRIIILLAFLGFIAKADNEIYINQVGSDLNLDVEQLGGSNLIGGLDAVSGQMTALELTGGSMTLDINQLGDSNKFIGDIILDSLVGFFEFDGDSNTFEIQVDPTDTYSADGGNYYVDVTGSSNDFELNVATNALAEYLDLDWIINGDLNTIDYTVDIDGATSYLDIDGDSNSVVYNGSGYADGYFYLDQTGSSRAFNITQSSTLASDWLKIISTGNNGTVCIIQSDSGSTSC